MRTDTLYPNVLPFFRRPVRRLHTCVLMGAVLCALLIGPPGAQAQSGNIIYVDADAPGNDDGSSWTDAYTNLQDALANATGSDEIWMAAGTYIPSSPVDAAPRIATFEITGDQDGLQIYGGFEGTETRRSDRDPSVNETILSGDLDGDDGPDSDGDGLPDSGRGDNSYHVLVFNGGEGFGDDSDDNITPDTVLDGVTITGGNANASSPDPLGGGLFCDGVGSGNACSPSLTEVTFTGNSAGRDGGAIYNDGRGGVSSPQITNATFTGNSAGFGGAIYNDGQGGASSPQITNAAFMGNSAGFDGGAIYNDGSNGTSSPQITNAIFTGNSAGENGGGIYNTSRGEGTSSPQIIGSTFTGNSAFRGGAIYIDSGINSTGGPQITNAILWGNTASGNGPEIFDIGIGPEPTLAYTLIEGGLPPGTDDGGNNLDADPLFADAGDPAGPDGRFGTADDGLQVRTGSPVVDAGANTPFEPGGIAEDVTTDLRGDARIQDGDGDGTATVTLGAYEAAIDAVDLRLTATPTAVAGDDPTSLTFRLANRGNAAPTGVAVDLGPPVGLTLTKTSGRGTLSGGTWTIGSVPGDGEAQLTVEVERTSALEATLPATATLQSGYTVPSGASDLTDPERNTAEWVSLPAPYGSGQALTLDGDGDYVSADTASEVMADAEAFTMEAWVRVGSTTDRPAVLAFNGAVEDNKNILFYDSGQFQYYDPDITFQSSSDTFAPEQWHHVAVVIETDDSGTLYVNGTEQATFTTSVRPVSGGRFSIGQEWDTSTPSDFLAGQIDEVR
ncbi:hypothetical protein CRI93_11440, partial [Longimonas halophila]